eukprot:TRINITY_DN4136_c0_g1_i2.p1 TRINITY_DN4136_c0_g1~~TRINITY_DN4136_c0_g1_i2.p1  ORF type:complete len:253 (+),score=77.54 TRINITY_DN4136_c0_g1_i2:947-1705(+)
MHTHCDPGEWSAEAKAEVAGLVKVLCESMGGPAVQENAKELQTENEALMELSERNGEMQKEVIEMSAAPPQSFFRPSVTKGISFFFLFCIAAQMSASYPDMCHGHTDVQQLLAEYATLKAQYTDLLAANGELQQQRDEFMNEGSEYKMKFGELQAVERDLRKQLEENLRGIAILKAQIREVMHQRDDEREERFGTEKKARRKKMDEEEDVAPATKKAHQSEKGGKGGKGKGKGEKNNNTKSVPKKRPSNRRA